MLSLWSIHDAQHVWAPCCVTDPHLPLEDHNSVAIWPHTISSLTYITPVLGVCRRSFIVCLRGKYWSLSWLMSKPAMNLWPPQHGDSAVLKCSPSVCPSLLCLWHYCCSPNPHFACLFFLSFISCFLSLFSLVVLVVFLFSVVVSFFVSFCDFFPSSSLPCHCSTPHHHIQSTLFQAADFLLVNWSLSAKACGVVKMFLWWSLVKYFLWTCFNDAIQGPNWQRNLLVHSCPSLKNSCFDCLCQTLTKLCLFRIGVLAAYLDVLTTSSGSRQHVPGIGLDGHWTVPKA